jgi:hypothetical protein
MKNPLPWSDLCRSSDYAGMWVALDKCRFDSETRQPIEGDVVDSDNDLAALCGRMRESRRTNCAIVYCDDEVLVENRRSTLPPPTLRPAARG